MQWRVHFGIKSLRRDEWQERVEFGKFSNSAFTQDESRDIYFVVKTKRRIDAVTKNKWMT